MLALRATGASRVLTPRAGWLWRASRLAIPLLGLILPLGGRSNAQPAASEPSGGPLPSVIYPLQVPNAAPPDQGPSAAAPEPAPATGEAGPTQYVLIDGVWGYWDGDRHFHRAPNLIEPGRQARPANPVGARANDGIRHADTPNLEIRRQFAPRPTVFLPNPPVRAIVAPSPTPRDRNPTH